MGMAEVAPGTFWASQSSEGIYQWNGHYFQLLPAAGLSPGDDRVGALLVAKDGSCWMAGARGLKQFTNTDAAANDGILDEFRY